ncbi:hypothetical protein RJ639_013689, partial [Escallonia herrerae]
LDANFDVGLSLLLQNFHESTIGAAFFSQTLAVNDVNVKFEIWDTAGQERYHSLAPMYYRGAAAAVSFDRAKKWVQELQAQGQHPSSSAPSSGFPSGGGVIRVSNCSYDMRAVLECVTITGLRRSSPEVFPVERMGLTSP